MQNKSMQNTLTLITGGARSGKSRFAETYVKEKGVPVLYVATAEPFDGEMQERIRRHQADRPAHWKTVEVYRQLDQAVPHWQWQGGVILLDCVTLWVSNMLFEYCPDGVEAMSRDDLNRVEARMLQSVDDFLAALTAAGINGVLVTNELGMGLVPEQALSRFYRDVAGRVNQKLAQAADSVYFIVSGLPLQLK